MIFNSYEFLVFFAAITSLFWFSKQVGENSSKFVLVFGSLFFYGWWKFEFLFLLLFSVAGNFIWGNYLRKKIEAGNSTVIATSFGVIANLGLLGYFKYAGFFASSTNFLFNATLPVPDIILPLAISFFTFQQIAYLVDTGRGESPPHSLLDYALFVTFFPQLIAGPIVHHKEMLPQFAKTLSNRFSIADLNIGLAIFSFGLFKKVILADNIAPFADKLFDAAANGYAPTFLEAWGGALAYSLQIYFDFSGYSDMAIGIGRTFGIKLPLNFFSPYKSTSIIDFWRRWHITLSRFLRDHIYIPLGGSRRGRRRRHFNLLLTMLLGGLWHGAGWTFVVWGGIHGVLLSINHGWRYLFRHKSNGVPVVPNIVKTTISVGATFFVVVIAWVFFRATSFDAALEILEGMSGSNGVVVPAKYLAFVQLPEEIRSYLGITVIDSHLQYFEGLKEVLWLAAGFFTVWFLPNTFQVMRRYRPALDPSLVAKGKAGMGFDSKANFAARKFLWRPSLAWASGIAVILFVSLMNFGGISPFIYFQF
jgi:D-alanyl-lipoteichoic acid acyltransferase DltB (MBOAT superfamily)